jgi:multicomponent Na+:H+ antiporter subunit B
VIELINVVLLAFMAITAVTVARLRNLLAVLVVSGFFSLLSAGMFLLLDAVDVAFTEAAVGAGIATVLGIGALTLSRSEEEKPTPRPWWPLIVVLATGATLVYGTLDMPPYGDPAAPVHQHVAPRYINQSPREIGVPNMVTSVLASYRGYDTLGETTVIFTAGIGVLLLLGGLRVRRKEEDDG